MALCGQSSFRVLAAVFCLIGMSGIVDRTPATWTVLTLAGLLSATLLPSLLIGPALERAKGQRPVEVTR
jgi:hypothetical protein